MIESNTDDWDRLPNGDIEICPVATWETAAAPNTVLLRLQVLQDGQIGSAQLALPAMEAAELARSLAWMAERARSGHSQGQA